MIDNVDILFDFSHFFCRVGGYILRVWKRVGKK